MLTALPMLMAAPRVSLKPGQSTNVNPGSVCVCGGVSARVCVRACERVSVSECDGLVGMYGRVHVGLVEAVRAFSRLWKGSLWA